MMCFIVYMCLVLQLIKLRMFSTTGNNYGVCLFNCTRLMSCPADFGGKFYEDKKV